MKLKIAILIAIAIFASLAAAVYLTTGHGDDGPQGLSSVPEWQRMANPGKLSEAHAFLEHDCKACHTPVKGAEAVNCIVCHANDDTILQRQPTAFHADVGSCKECHTEHRGRHAEMTAMDHNALAKIGRSQLEQATNASDDESAALLRWLKQAGTGDTKPVPSAFVHPALSNVERTLNCASCHSNEDQHFSLFGNNCASCHETEKWNIPGFRHPSPTSKDCVQCHQAPPSHYNDFKKISAKIAGKPHAKLSECYTCHQTASWPDIRGDGFYKNH